MKRRTFLRTAAVGAVGAVLTTGCGDAPDAPSGTAAAAPADYQRRAAQQRGATREMRLTAAPGEVEVAPGEVYRTWLYDGQFPGPEIRLSEGERLRLTLANEAPEGTTIHWHGIPVPNAMDGVPGLTQEPVAQKETFVYDFVADPPGSYLYHSHVGLQIDRGLIAPLVVEERQPHVSYDREYTVVLDDYLPGAPVPLRELADAGDGERGGRGGMGGMMGRGHGMMGRGGMMGGIVPPYAGLLVNGKLPELAPTFEVRRGERVRLRLMNPSGATTFRLAIGGHAMTVTHKDGQPVEPLQVDALRIGMGERYDVIVEADNPGAWPIVGVTVEGDAPPARALLRYTDAAGTRNPPADAVPEGLRGGRLLHYSALRPAESLPQRTQPDRTFDLTLSGGMMSTNWTIDGEVYPDAPPLEIREGEHVRIRMVNHSMMIHPMHLHGHFFRVGDALMDTVIVWPHMDQVTFDFVADNPGRWLFHCHNLYHLEAGMAREVRYV